MDLPLLQDQVDMKQPLALSLLLLEMVSAFHLGESIPFILTWIFLSFFFLTLLVIVVITEPGSQNVLFGSLIHLWLDISQDSELASPEGNKQKRKT